VREKRSFSEKKERERSLKEVDQVTLMGLLKKETGGLKAPEEFFEGNQRIFMLHNR